MMNLFLDSDGVFADMESSFEHIFGRKFREVEQSTAWKLIEDHDGFWENLPLCEGAYTMWDLFSQFSPTILTGCPSTGYENAVKGKAKFWAKNFGQDIPIITCRSKYKQNYMKNKGDLLIDDFIRNIKNWEKAGGKTIYHKSSEKTIETFNRLWESSSV